MSLLANAYGGRGRLYHCDNLYKSKIVHKNEHVNKNFKIVK